VIFQLSKLAKHVRLLPDAALVSAAADIDYVMRACQLADGDRLKLISGAAALTDLLSASHRLALRLSDALAQRYFSHAYDLPHATSAP
jgi:hypothetical protein